MELQKQSFAGECNEFIDRESPFVTMLMVITALQMQRTAHSANAAVEE